MNQTQQPADGYELDAGGVRTLDAAECWRILAAESLGRLAVRVDDGVDVFPVNFLVHDGAVFFRSAPGAKLVELTREPRVAFEVDGQYAHRAWSVVVRGVATRIGSEDEIWEAGVTQLHTWHPSDKFNYVRIQPASVSGRSFEKK